MITQNEGLVGLLSGGKLGFPFPLGDSVGQSSSMRRWIHICIDGFPPLSAGWSNLFFSLEVVLLGARLHNDFVYISAMFYVEFEKTNVWMYCKLQRYLFRDLFNE